MHENSRIRVLGNVDDFPLKAIDREKISQEINIPRFGCLQMLCKERLYQQEADIENQSINTMDVKVNVSRDEIESSQKNDFNYFFVSIF